MEAIYKSPNLLFESKDSELLFSLPISKKQILLVRVIKLYIFQLLFGLLFSVPGVAVYAYYEKPSAYFYVISIIMLILFPIIPTIIGCALGYITKQISVKFKARKSVQTVITFIFALAILMISFNSKGITENLIANVGSIDSSLRNIYYPINAYVSLVNKFDIIILGALLLVNLLFVILFVIPFSKKYFSIISKSKEHITHTKGEKRAILSFKQNSVLN